ncbi:hypothetical protein B0H15DRAFT_297609 [Mycena belliarum]|uniref:Uncharacterized protein n=1 Tax=Mycena belliarum TaxID=1033014 RepID=A0AAD6XQL4_9AGAR|nr:hypothetical protein B0H15DRAFT_297609 [Mycena belliae]
MSLRIRAGFGGCDTSTPVFERRGAGGRIMCGSKISAEPSYNLKTGRHLHSGTTTKWPAGVMLLMSGECQPSAACLHDIQATCGTLSTRTFTLVLLPSPLQKHAQQRARIRGPPLPRVQEIRELGSRVAVGDYGRITQGRRGLAFWRKNGTFLKEGNIFADGQAQAHGIPGPTEFGGDAAEGETWVVSQNAQQIDVAASLGGTTALADCRATGAFRFAAGRGAVLVMQNDVVRAIAPPGALRRLLAAPRMRGLVVVAEVHACASYARLLTARGGGTVALGLRVAPAATAPAAAAAAAVSATWVRSVGSGNFRAGVDGRGERRYCPLFRLVSLDEKAVSTGMRGEEEEEDGLDGEPPLPDAEPPWGICDARNPPSGSKR